MRGMKIVTIVGARPQFIKAAAISRALRERRQAVGAGAPVERIVHTGQHYDRNMSEVFFEEMDIPKPDYNLEIAGGSHGQMTGRMFVFHGKHRAVLISYPAPEEIDSLRR